MPTKQEMIERFAAAEAWVPGKRVRIDFGGDDGVAMLDGVAGRVSAEDGPADTSLGVSWDDWLAFAAGTLNPLTAVIAGRLRIDGDKMVALQLQGVLRKVAEAGR